MCINCWRESGAPTIINERVIAAALLIKEVYATEDGAVGGYGHIVFDDWNTDCVESCIRDAEAAKYAKDICEETRLASLKALLFFRDLTEDERGSALAILDGFITLKEPA